MRISTRPPSRDGHAGNPSRTGSVGRVDRLGVVLAAMAAVDGDAPSVVERVCAAAVGLLALSGCGISLMVEGQLEGSAGVSSPAIAAVQELQLEMGEGPCVEAWASAEPVMEGNLVSPTIERWPVFAQAAVRAGVKAVFAFPLCQGAIRIGVLVLYRDRVGDLSEEEWARGWCWLTLPARLCWRSRPGRPRTRYMSYWRMSRPIGLKSIRRPECSRHRLACRWMTPLFACALTRLRRAVRCVTSHGTW